MNLKLLAVVILSSGLVACGGGSTSSGGASVDVDISDSLKGLSQEPALASSAVSEGDSVSLNSVLTANLSEDSYMLFSFTAESDGEVAVLLNSAAEDFDLYVTSNDLDLSSERLSSEEQLVFSATSGETYSIEVSAYYGSGDFTVKLVEANRTSLVLSNNEYYVSLPYETEVVCDTSDYNFDGEYQVVINWLGGYLKDGSEKSNFNSASGNTFTILTNYSDSEPEYDYSYSEEYTLQLTVNPESGVVSGTETGTSTEINGSDVDDCAISTTYVGRIVL